MQPPNLQRFPPTVLRTSTNRGIFPAPAIQITCEEVTDLSAEDQDAIAIASSEAEEQFHLVKEFPNLFSETMPTELPPLGNSNHHIDSKPGSEW